MQTGTYVLFVVSLLNAALTYVFVYTLDLGLLSASLASGISYWLSFALLVAYARAVAGSACWGGWSRRSLHNLGPFVRLALLGILHVGTEWLAFEVVALAAGRLGTISLAAQSVVMVTDHMLYSIPFSIGVVASARIGNLLGAKQPKAAARAASAATWLGIALGAVALAVLMAVKGLYGRLFSSDERVVQLTARVMPYVALFQVADGLNSGCGGSLRGMGRQHIGAVVNFIAFYVCALPLDIYLAFHDGWGLPGLWVGQCFALYLIGFVRWAIVARSDWDLEVQKALARLDLEQPGLLSTSTVTV
jgi:MATE family multidrug resistance protein